MEIDKLAIAMTTSITNGIKVSVTTQFEPRHSSPAHGKHVHSYHITIENNSDETVQLLTRLWIIMDSDLNIREVRGEGVIGEQPIIPPGGSHSYSSWTPLRTAIGKMSGSYQMRTLSNHSLFDVRVPVFVLSTNGVNN